MYSYSLELVYYDDICALIPWNYCTMSYVILFPEITVLWHYMLVKYTCRYEHDGIM
jgi:hypothetical protein